MKYHLEDKRRWSHTLCGIAYESDKRGGFIRSTGWGLGINVLPDNSCNFAAKIFCAKCWAKH